MNRFLTISLLFAILISASFGQYYFGQNKIQPFDYEWEIHATPHFDIYYYPEELEIAELAGELAEKTWARYTAHFRFAPAQRIPLIIYSSPALFSETHTTPFIIPEGVGGFTEFIKGRVIMPFDGSLAHFEHILPHELVHVWQLHYNEFLHDAHELFFLDFPPLWFVEGQAEFLSQRHESVDERTALVSALANDRFVLPEHFGYISGTYQMYKEGENFLRFLTDEFGEDTDVRLFERVWEHGWFSDVFEITLGMSLEDAGVLWRQWLWQRFGDYVASRTPARVIGEKVTGDGFYFSPVQLDSTTIACKGNRMGYTGIYLIEKGSAKLLEKLEMTESAVATRLFGNRIATHGDSLIAFSTKARGTDRLYILNLRTGKKKKFEFEEFLEITSPAFTSDGKKVVFSASEIAGYFDIAMLDIQSGKLEQITDDKYYDSDPAVLLDGSVLFVSDRVNKKKLGLFKISPGKDLITTLELPYGVYRPRSLSVSDDGQSMLFVADDDTFPDVYLLKLATDSLFRVTHLSEPAHDVSWGFSDTILISRGDDFNVAIVKIPLDSAKFVGTVFEDTITDFRRFEEIAPSLASKAEPKKPNVHRLTFDLAQGEIATSSAQEMAGGLEIMLSDMVGDRRLYFFFLEAARSWEDMLSDANIIVAYDKQGLRWNKTLGVYHLHLFTYNRFDGSYDERQAGILGGASYALSRFTRIEGTTFLYYSDRGEWQTHRQDGIIAPNLSLIRDTSLWGITGPMDGMRGNLTVGTGVGLSGTLYHYLVSFDLRHYLRLSRRSCWAHRLVLRHSDGDEPQRFYMGGTWDFRGYPYFSFFGKNQALFNSEIRFPLLDRIVFATPIIDIDIRGLRGVIFFDAGDAWETKPDLVGSYGVGARMSLDGYIVLRFDLAQTTDFKNIDPHWKWDIFFGWDF